jgi:Holliday junction resolvase RusA-like endonuclease
MQGSHVYTTKKTTVAEREIRAAWEDQGKPRLPDESALGLSVRLAVVRPQGHFKKDGSLSAQGLRHPIPRNKKPDLDNAIKLVMDALNSRAYRDDVQIAEAQIKRVWDEWPSTTVRVYVLDGTEQGLL